jgi:hypothetical protein
VLSYSLNSNETLSFFTSLKDAIFSNETFQRRGKTQRKFMRLSLDNIEHISLPCAVVLSAELKRWTLLTGVAPKLLNFSRWNYRTRSILTSLGTLQHLGIRRKSYKRFIDCDDQEQVTLVELTSAGIQDGEKVEQLQSDLISLAKFFKPKQYIFRALLEATNNAIEHAYENNAELLYPIPGGKRWYATASYDMMNDSLRFFVYDQGIGIPESLRTKDTWRQKLHELTDRLGLSDHDSDLIDAAFQIGKTRTGQKERGKGLKDMQSVLEKAGAGYIRVISGQGDCTLSAHEHVEKRRHSSHIGGTLVEWSIPVSALIGEGSEDGRYTHSE